VSNLIASAPAALDTLDELAAALGDDANFATTTATAIGLKAPLASPALTGTPTAPTAAVGTNTTQLATTAFVQATNPTGAVIAFAGSSAPSGWFLCFGQEVSISSNGALYAVVGTTYGSLTNGSGGVGTTHFRLPDLRGRTIAGIDNMGGVDAGRLSIANTPGTTTGAETVTIGTANLPPHQHAIDHDHASFAMTTNVNSQLHSHSYTTVYLYTGNVDYGNYYNGYYPTGSSTGVENIAHAHSSDVNVPNFTGSSGNGGFANTALNNMQPTIVLNYIIKA
jgi:microcystin-dependent protein